MGDELQFGLHTLKREDPHLVVYRLRETIDAPELLSMTTLHRGWLQGLPYFLVLADASELDRVTSDALRVAHEWGEIGVPRAWAVVTRRFAVRAAVDMLTRAIMFVWDSPLETRFFLDEASAKEWLEERRRVYAATAAERR